MYLYRFFKTTTSLFRPTSYKILLISLFLIAAVLRLWGLGNFDISPDESHFIGDAYRFFTGDPYTVPRHHPFRHGVPFVGHPFLAQDLMVIFFKLIGPSVTAGRLVIAFSNLAALAGAFILSRMLFGNSVAFLTLLLLVFLPHDVRYARDAHIDPLLGATLVWAAIFFWKVLTSQRTHWGGWLGITSALVWASKINGPFLFLFYGLAVLFIIGKNQAYVWIKEHFKQLLLFVISFTLFFILLVDPKSYIDALINPADPDISSFTKVFSFFLENTSIFTKRLVFYLYSIPFALLVIYGLSILLKRHHKEQLFLLSLVIIYGHIFITHAGHSGEYGYVVLNPYFAMLAAISIEAFRPKLKLIALIILIIFFIPLLILHGLRIDLGGATQLTKFNDSNFRYGQRPYRDAIKAINELPGNPVVLWIKDGDRPVPTMDIRGGVRLWPFFELNSVDTVLTASVQNKNELILYKDFKEYREFSYRGTDKVWILRRSDYVQ